MFRHGSVYWLMWFWEFIASFIPGVGQAERMAAAGIVKGRAVAGRVVAMERCPSSNGLEVAANLIRENPCSPSGLLRLRHCPRESNRSSGR